jgi:Putative transposase
VGVVPGGGISPDGERWVSCRPGFFLPVRVLSSLFRRLFLHYVENAYVAGRLKFFSALQHLNEQAAFLRYLAPVRAAKWIVYAKPPFAGPKQVLDYVGRYTHRIAISNNRLLSINDGNVRFRWKDYRHDNRLGTMTVTAEEFIRRFLLHVLPEGFQRIRYYGFLCNRYREEKLARCRELLGMVTQTYLPDTQTNDQDEQREAAREHSVQECPACHHGRMLVVEVILKSIHPSRPRWDTS